MFTQLLENLCNLHYRLRRIDFFLLLCTTLVLVIGVCFVASATAGRGDTEGALGFAGRQMLFICMGITLLIALQRVHYLSLLRLAWPLYFFGVALLIAVLFTRQVNGAKKWFDLYFLKLQPSELMKPFLILVLAHYLMYRDSYKRLLGLGLPLVLAGVPMILILKQPDLGMTLVFVPVVLAMLFAAGARLTHLLITALAGTAGMVCMWEWVIREYQKGRVLAWLDPTNPKYRDIAWQPQLAKIAIGSGGFAGQGFESGGASLRALPENHTDFIFAVLAHEGGFILCLGLLVLFYLIVVSGLGIAARTREPAGRLIAVGCVTMLFVQVLINTSVALGLMPTTGLTLPLVSYGGSSMLSSFISIGLLINIGSQQEPVLAREDFD